MAEARARILFVAHTAEIGGPTHSLMMLLQHLRDRYQVAVLLPERGPLRDWLVDAGIAVFMIPGLRVETVFRIYRLIRREQFDLVYGNNPNNSARNSLLAAKLAGKPFIWHFRGMKWHWGWYSGVFLRWADKIVAVSHACAQSLARFYPVDEIEVVYNGVEVSAFCENGAAAGAYLREQVGLPPEAQVLIGVSHLLPRKGLEQAIATMTELAKRAPNVHLVIAGSCDRDPSYAESIRRMIDRTGLEGRIHLLGLRTDIPLLLQGADVFLHTARRDPHPRAVIEAMAAGLPVVSFAVDGVAETVVDGETGYLIPPGDTTGMANAVLSFLHNPERRRDFGRRGRERVREHFTAAGTAARVGRIIDSLLVGRTSDAASSRN
jgi:glycosyltransferase involved in cell wall biosynthesis